MFEMCFHENKRIDGPFTLKLDRGRLGRDRMVVGFTTSYAIIPYQH